MLMSPARRAEVVWRRLLLLEKIGAAGSKSSRSADYRNPDAEATPSSLAHDEEEEEEEAGEPAVQLIRKRSRETTAGASVVPKSGGVPLIGKRSNLRSLYRFSPEVEKKTPEKEGVVIIEPSEPAQKRPRVTIKPLKATGAEADKEKRTAEEKKEAGERQKEKTKEKPVITPVGADPKDTRTAAATVSDKAQGPEVVHITGLDQPHYEKRKEPEIERITPPTQPDVTQHSVKVTSSIGGSGPHAAGGASSGGAAGFTPQNIGAKDTLGDIYYKTYTEEARGNAPHQAPWGLKQKDTFNEFGPCRDWFLNSFPPGEVNQQRARTHDELYQA
ncbi:hypothetical protein HanXRQr2_Chr11g0512261 [Helianthus annuus]|uniref:Uncharacterized protein n=1 Tax=Helianthus annuus TaxID=4232 RepID=A0A9K3N291_HELAN|nr:hypothetical protein HanXRQr2_Chr11g0512261 [Helianthus annuus]